MFQTPRPSPLLTSNMTSPTSKFGRRTFHFFIKAVEALYPLNGDPSFSDAELILQFLERLVNRRVCSVDMSLRDDKLGQMALWRENNRVPCSEGQGGILQPVAYAHQTVFRQ